MGSRKVELPEIRPEDRTPLVKALTAAPACRVSGSEINANLGADKQRIGDVPRAAGPENLLEIRLDEVRPVAETEGVVPFQDRLMVLYFSGRVETLCQPLGAGQVIAELPIDDSK